MYRLYKFIVKHTDNVLFANNVPIYATPMQILSIGQCLECPKCEFWTPKRYYTRHINKKINIFMCSDCLAIYIVSIKCTPLTIKLHEHETSYSHDLYYIKNAFVEGKYVKGKLKINDYALIAKLGHTINTKITILIGKQLKNLPIKI